MLSIPTLLRGDCLQLMKDLPDQSIDMILCDLPYGTTRNAWDSVIDLPSLWAQYKRVAKPNAAIVQFAQTPFDKVLGASNLPMLRYEWIWEKTAATGFLNAKKAPLKAHENLLVFYDQLPVYNPIMTEGHTIKRVNVNHAGNSSNYGKQLTREPYESTSRYPRSVLRFPKDNRLRAFHPTQKPVALLEYMIRTYTHEGALVLDNTMGGGSAGVACVNTGRGFIGMEKDDEKLGDHYYRIACQRVGDALAALDR